jgi:dTDP-4-dehydrorhamnose reductase
MLRLAQSRDTVTVVNDQVGCPTYAPALAGCLLEMAGRTVAQDFNDWGTYHLAGKGCTDRASMARKIFEISERYGGPTAEVVPVPTSDYPTPAQRPLYARFDISETVRVFGIDLLEWEIGLDETIGILIEEFDKT